MMKSKLSTKLTLSAALLGAALAAPTLVMAEDVVDDATIAQAGNPDQFGKTTVKHAKAARAAATAAQSETLADMEKRLQQESMQPGGVGG